MIACRLHGGKFAAVAPRPALQTGCPPAAQQALLQLGARERRCHWRAECLLCERAYAAEIVAFAGWSIHLGCELKLSWHDSRGARNRP